MADAPTPPRSTDPLLEGEEPIDVGYEAATPWLQAHCQPTNETTDFVARGMSFGTIRTESPA